MGFPKLQELRLEWLGSLECVGPMGAASGSGGLGPLPHGQVSQGDIFPEIEEIAWGWDNLKCLEEIKGEREWLDAIQWDDPTMKTSLDGK